MKHISITLYCSLSTVDTHLTDALGITDRSAQIYIAKCRDAVQVLDDGRVKCPLYMFTGSIDTQSISDMTYLLGYPFSVSIP